MQHTPSRREKREMKFYYLAEKGYMSCRDIFLFKGEASNLVKHGFTVTRLGGNDRKSLPSTVSWDNSFKNGIPLIVQNYIHGIIETFPKLAVENWAQELYVIAARTNHQKIGQKNNE